LPIREPAVRLTKVPDRANAPRAIAGELVGWPLAKGWKDASACLGPLLACNPLCGVFEELPHFSFIFPPTKHSAVCFQPFPKCRRGCPRPRFLLLTWIFPTAPKILAPLFSMDKLWSKCNFHHLLLNPYPRSCDLRDHTTSFNSGRAQTETVPTTTCSNA
jgi:hypothetical protein